MCLKGSFFKVNSGESCGTCLRVVSLKYKFRGKLWYVSEGSFFIGLIQGESYGMCLRVVASIV